MTKPVLALLVKFKSALPFDEVVKVMNDRIDEFRALKGLQQKYYLQDRATGEVCGFYLWESEKDFTAYRESDLRASIAAAYQATSEPQIQLMDVLEVLRS